jgi:hypothetical protein
MMYDDPAPQPQHKLRGPKFGEDEVLYAVALQEENPSLSAADARAHARRQFMLWSLGHARSVDDLKSIVARLITEA